MPRLRVHQILAILVLLAAAAWVLTGKFSYIGSERADAEELPPHRATRPSRRGVPCSPSSWSRARYSRSIRIAGRTEPDKTSVLAARDSGIIRALPAADGQSVPPAR